MRKLLLALLLVMVIPVLSWGADVNKTRISNGYMWDIAGAITATGNSNTMVGTMGCDTYTAFINASGAVNITAAFTVEDEAGSNDITVKTYTLSAATSTGYTWSFPTPRMYIVFTITAGQIDDVKVYCKEK